MKFSLNYIFYQTIKMNYRAKETRLLLQLDSVLMKSCLSENLSFLFTLEKVEKKNGWQFSSSSVKVVLTPSK